MDPTELGVSDVQLTWVVNDVALGPLRQEHGYAVWIKMPGGTVLLDTGGSGDVLVGNLAALGLNPADLDAVVVSHAHDDHTGGLSDLLPLLRPGTPLYAHPDVVQAPVFDLIRQNGRSRHTRSGRGTLGEDGSALERCPGAGRPRSLGQR